jgi:hypothetical protein
MLGHGFCIQRAVLWLEIEACVRTRAQLALLSIANAYIVRPDDECHRLEHKAEETRRALRGTVSTIKSRTTPNRTTRRGVASLRARA